MKNFNFKKAVPHLIAIGIFLLVTVIFCKPALESGVVLKQADVSSWEAMSHQSFEYKEKTGHFPLWTTSMFGGMPAYQIAIDGTWTPLMIVDRAMQLWLPKPMNFFFLACICFYFLCICLRIRPFAAVLGALAFAYCSYSPIIITAGHDTKMLTLAYSPAVIGAVILLFNKKYLAGFSLTALFTALEIGSGHQQVSYYLFLILGIMTVFFVVNALKKKQTAGLVKSLGLLILAGIIGVAVNAISLFPSLDYAKYSKRGGQLMMTQNTSTAKEKIENGKTVGLSQDYAFQWSYGKAETMSLMFPGVMGYGSYYANRDGEDYLFPSLKEDAHVVSYMTNTFPQASPEQVIPQMSQSLYWGDQPFTSGPVYLGAVICFLFIFGMFYLDNKHKWWIFTCALLGILLSWGHNFAAFNGFLFDHLPLYNKFRVPTIALVIPQMMFPIIAALALDKLSDKTDPDGMKKFRSGLIATAVVFVLAFGFYMSSGFSNENTQRTAAFNAMLESKSSDMQSKYNELNQKFEPQRDNRIYENWVMQLQQNPDAQKTARNIVSEIRKDRASFFLNDILKSLLFVLVAAGIIFFYLKNKMNALLMLGGVTLVAMIDLLAFGSNYLNSKSYDNKENYDSVEFPQSDADKQIMADTDPNYRVFNESVSSPFEESKTSYYHKSIGGYHAAKMGIYDDLSTYQMNGNINPAVLNMLNAKYLITGQGNKLQAIRNPDALGNAWFIKGVEFVHGPVAEMTALNNLNTKDSAVVDDSFRPLVTAFSPADSSSTIKMTAFDNDAISYQSNSATANVAVFSEIYYKDWKAYIDGKAAPYFKANYVLRAMVVPAGAHKIDFKFEPEIFFMSKKVSAVASYLLVILLIAALGVELKRKQPETTG